MFDPKLREHYRNTAKQGSLKGDNVLCLKAGSRSAGEVAELYVRFEGDLIVESKYKVFGCPYAIAMVGFLADWVMGKSKAQLREFELRLLFEAFDIPQDKKHTAMLAEDVVKSFPS